MARSWRVQANDQTEAETLTFRIMPGGAKTIGRAPHADFVIDRALVSRLHCRLTNTYDHLEVEDLGSTNGTFVNDQRVERKLLSVGDRLRVGRVELIISADDAVS